MFDKMRATVKNDQRERAYFDEINIVLNSMFTWKTPLGVDAERLEKWLHITGSFGAAFYNGAWHFGDHAGLTGNLTEFDDGDKIQFTPTGGVTITGDNSDGVFICYNNTMRAPCWDVITYADAFAQIDKAIYSLSRWAGVAPILSATDDKTANALNGIIAKLLNGELFCITSENIRAILGNGCDAVTVSELTKPEIIGNAQYLAELADTLQRRLYNKYGVSIQNSNKRAQTNTDEIHGYDNLACIIPDDMLKKRRDFCDAANKYIGSDVWAVDFSPLWKHTHEIAKGVERNEDMDDNRNDSANDAAAIADRDA